MRFYSPLLFLLLLSACVDKELHKEVKFNGATFGIESFARQTMATTLRHNELYFELGERDRKYIDNPDVDYFGFFPTDTAIIKKIKPIFIDTTIRYAEQYPPTQSKSTLYLSPTEFTEEEFNLIVSFIKDEYTKPDRENMVLKWLNYNGPDSADSIFWNTINAVTYSDLTHLQPTFKGVDENHWARIQVNNTVDVAGIIMTDMQTSVSFYIRQDTLFYHKADEELFEQLKTYTSESGKTVADYYKIAKGVTDLDRFFLPPFQ